MKEHINKDPLMWVRSPFIYIVDAKYVNPIYNLSRYIVECNEDVQPPAYLRRRDTYNLRCIASPDCTKKLTSFHSLKEEAWPKMEELGLDDSQMKALQLALTTELAIIQGPPGTGESLRSYCFKSSFILFLRYIKIGLLCLLHSLRKNPRWPKDCSGSVD